MHFFISTCLCMLLLLIGCPTAATAQTHLQDANQVQPTATIKPLYQISDDSYKPRKAAVSFSKSSNILNFRSARAEHINLFSNTGMVRTIGSSVQLYSIGTNALPSEQSVTKRRSGGARGGEEDWDDWGTGGATDGNAGDGGEQSNESPIGSPYVLAFLAMAYVVYRYRKSKVQTSTAQK